MSKDRFLTKDELIREVRKLRDENTRFRKAVEEDRWFELVEYFDATKIVRLPADKMHGQRVFLLGMYHDCLVVEVPKEARYREVQQLRDVIREATNGAPTIIVTSDVRFLKLRMVDDQTVERLNAAVEKKDDEAAEQTGTGEAPESAPEGSGP